MKKRLFAACLLCFLLLASCGTHAPENPSSAEETGAESSVTDDHASDAISPAGDVQIPAGATALLDTLLDEENNFTAEREGGIVEWIDSDRVGEIRARVNAVGTPFLTEESVLRIARRVAAFHVSATEASQAIRLSNYDGVSTKYFLNGKDEAYLDYGEEYTFLLAYTLYLFTPSKYAFSDLDFVQPDAEEADNGSFKLYLPLAGNYRDRLHALQALREGKRCIVLPMDPSVRRARTIDFFLVQSPCILHAGEEQRLLRLTDMGEDAGGFLEQMQLRATLLSRPELKREEDDRVIIFDAGSLEDGRDVYSLIDPDDAVFLRETVDKLTFPLLDSPKAADLMAGLAWDLELLHIQYPILLPDADGTGEVLLDPQVLSGEEIKWKVEAYFIDLFTPRAYRFAGGVDDMPEDCFFYLLKGNYRTPEEALAALKKDSAAYVRVIEGSEPLRYGH